MKGKRFEEKWIFNSEFQGKIQVISNINYNLDVFSLRRTKMLLYHYLHVVHGGINQAYTSRSEEADETAGGSYRYGDTGDAEQRYEAYQKKSLYPFMPE